MNLTISKARPIVLYLALSYIRLAVDIAAEQLIKKDSIGDNSKQKASAKSFSVFRHGFADLSDSFSQLTGCNSLLSLESGNKMTCGCKSAGIGDLCNTLAA